MDIIRKRYRVFFRICIFLLVFGAGIHFAEKSSNIFSVEAGVTKKGFYTDSKNHTYYYKENGTKAKGLMVINDARYLFDSSTGIMKTGFQTYNGYKYYFSQKTGKALTGLFKVGDYSYYGNGKGILLGGIVDITSGTKAGRYLFDTNTKRMKTGFQTYKGYKYYFSVKTGKALKGLFTIGNAKYFGNSKGILLKGLITINTGDKAGVYLFDAGTRKMLTGIQNYTTSDKKTYTYFFDLSSGKRTAGFQKIGNDTYYFSPEYYTIQKGLRTIGGKTYLFDSKGGKMLTGMQNYTSSSGDTYTYYFNTKTGVRESGFKEVSGKKYYFSPQYYTLQKGYCLVIDKKSYYLNDVTGEISKGVFQVGNDDIGYFYKYFDPETATGFGETGLQTINGELYYIHPTYNYACMGLYYVNNESDNDGLYYFAGESDEKPGRALRNYSMTISNLVFTSDSNGKVTYSSNAEGTDPYTQMFMYGLSNLGLPYGTPENGLDGNITQLRCNSFAALCYRQLNEEKFKKLVWQDFRDAIYPYQQSLQCQNEGKYSTDINTLQVGDLLFWNNDNCGTAINECMQHTDDPNGKHIHHVSVYMGQGTDGYHYTIEATEIDQTMCVRVTRIKDLNIYNTADEAGTHFYISAIGNL